MAKESSCPKCGYIIDIGIFCPKCGSKLQLDTTTDFGSEIREQFIALHKLMDKFRFKIYKKLTIADERILLNFRAGLEELEQEYGITPEIIAATKKTSDIDSDQSNLVLCPRCSIQVQRGKFCPKCGSPLGEGNVRKLESRIYKVRSILQNYQIFMRNIQDTLTEELVTITNKIDSLLKEILDKLTRQHNNVIDTMKIRQRARVQQPIAITRDISAPTPVSGQRVHKIGDQTIPVAAHAPSRLTQDISGRQVVPTQKKSFYSKFEKNLVNYWFFYLSIFLLTIGVILTVVFVVRDIPDVNIQLAVIYSIGGGILVIGELITILTKRRKIRAKIAEAKEKSEVQEDEDKQSQAVVEPQERSFPLPQFATVIVFIGLLTIYTAGIIGFGSGLPRSIFTFVSFGVALLAVVLGVLNDSEMTTLTGFIPVIAFIFLDVSWGGGSSLNEIGMLLAFVIPIIVATLIGIFFNKWWGSIVLITVVPVALCIPVISTKMALEFIPLVMIPLMTLLIVRFNKNKIPFTHKKILVFISQILPAIALGVISIPGVIDSSTEPAWAKVYPVEIIISTAIILGIGFFYQFIQEKYLDIKSKNCVFYYLGQGLVGLISIIMVVTNLDNMNGFIYSIIYFSLFFLIGLLGIFKFFKEHLTLVGTIISFGLAEVQAILMFTLSGVTPTTALAIQLIVSVIFTVLAVAAIALSKYLNVPKYLLISWVIVSVINNIVFIFLQPANYWFVFASVMLFLVLPLLSFGPNKEETYYVGQIAVGVVSIVMVLANLLNPLNYIINLIYCLVFFTLGIFNVIYKNYFSPVATIISFTIAEAHAILLLILLEPSTTFKLILYFVIAISFTIIAILSIALSKKLEISRDLFLTLVIFAIVNSTILMFINKLTIWYVLSAMVLLTVLPILNIKPNIDLPYYIGQVSIGVLISVMLGLNSAHPLNYIAFIIFFSVFFIIGILGLIKALKNNYSLPGTMISFGFAEIIAILTLIFLSTTPLGQLSIYFIIAISFLVLSLLAMPLVKFIEVSEYLFIGWIGASLVNSLLLLFMNKVNNWYVFAVVLLFFAVSAIEFKPNTDRGQLISKCAVGVLSIIMVTTNLSDSNNFTYNVVFFAMFFLIGVVGLLNVLKKNFNRNGILVSLGFAEIQAVLMLVLFNYVTNTLQTVLYFIVAISFNIVAFVTILFPKVFHRNSTLLVGWAVISAVNATLLGLFAKLDPWFTFIAVILLLALVALNNMPIFGQKLQHWRHIALTSIILVLTVITIFMFTGHLRYFPHETLVVYLIFALVSIPVFINWKKEEVAIIG